MEREEDENHVQGGSRDQHTFVLESCTQCTHLHRYRVHVAHMHGRSQ